MSFFLETFRVFNQKQMAEHHESDVGAKHHPLHQALTSVQVEHKQLRLWSLFAPPVNVDWKLSLHHRTKLLPGCFGHL